MSPIGGVDFWGGGQVDLAQRPFPGSALKPFIYGMAFDELILHPATLMSDAPTMFGDYAPKDFEGTFQGSITARDALRMSLNIPAVMVLDRVGPLSFTTNLQNAGATLDFPAGESTPSLPVALGGLGISLADITMLYSGIANGGTARPLRCVQGALDGAAHRIFGPAAFYSSNSARGAAGRLRWGMNNSRVRFKTGTSYGVATRGGGFSNDYGRRLPGAPTPRARAMGREARRRSCSRRSSCCRRTCMPTTRRHPRAAPPPTTSCRLRCVCSAASAPAPPETTCRRRPSRSPNGTVVPLPPDGAKDRTIVPGRWRQGAMTGW